ncbi:TonB-dependent receptor plug domain-containing protein [Sphingomicrobium nitratireducens]|uniref:TonB-dependent receptor plug domain-containing protein n=1 Tax=Sphingomicrobium nitratireducens TaxID=2964666 RepID=UPI00224096EF|nr:TonB-dependent receptor plug domain-containing protein [Sphingomicrobium nitratireducens]
MRATSITTMTKFMLGASLAAMTLASPAFASGDTPSETGEEAFDPATSEVVGSQLALANRVFTYDDLAQYAPKSALDMVRQIPGFSISGTDQGQRGLGQASQNVLLNGQRMSGKSNDAASALSRIDAKDVIRIEILDGATLDIPGLAGSVANIVYRASSIGGNFSYSAQLRKNLPDTLYDAEVSLNGRSGATEWSASLSNESPRQGHWGPEYVYAPDGTLLLSRDEFGRYYGDQPRLRASLSRTALNGNILNFNATGALEHRRNSIAGDIFDPDGNALGEELFRSSTRAWEMEVGGDYEFALGSGRLKTIGLQSFEHSPTINRFVAMNGNRDRFEQTLDSSESILRSEYRWKGGPADWQVSLEGAYNKLDSEAYLFLEPAGMDEFEIPLPGANATITEKRAEAIVSYGRPIAEGLTMQLNLGAEFSRLAVSGQAGEGSGEYVRPKGSLSLAWRASPTLSVNAEIERRVDQLSFFDFLAAVDLADDVDRGTNIGLVPSQRWRMRVEALKRVPGWGAIKPFVEYARIEDLIETIPISDTQEALGNVPLATALYIGGEGTLQLDKLGWRGAKIDFNGGWQDTRIEDPLLGTTREISARLRHNYNVNLRHDVPGSNWAWGAGISQFRQSPFYRLEQVSRSWNKTPNANLFVEHKDVAGMTVRASVYNLLDSTDNYWREAYVDRRDGPLAFRESRAREYGRIFAFSVSGKI